MRIGQELDIAHLEHHMQGQALTHFLQHIRRFELGGGERWDESRGGKAGEGADVVGVPSGAVSPFAVAGVMVGLL